MKYKIIFCTIAVGNEYNGYAQRFYHTIQKVFGSKVLIVTDNPDYFINTPKHNLIIKKLDPSYKTRVNWAHGFADFNYNLKYVPIKYAREFKEEQFIMYFDCDWFARQAYSLQRFYDFMDDSFTTFDAIAGRDLRIFHEKQNRQIIPIQKLIFYDLHKTEKYDNGQIVNEQYLILKNSDKIDTFVDRWAKLEHKCSTEGGIAYAEGIEIGMAAIDANINFRILNSFGDLFWFYSNKQHTYFGA